MYLLLEVSKADLPFNPNPGVSHICGKLRDDVPLYVVLYPQAGRAWFTQDSMSRRRVILLFPFKVNN